MKKRLLSLILAVIMTAGMMPVDAFVQDANGFVWAGAMNYNDANNQVTETEFMTAVNRTELKWQYPLNTTVENYGAYYAGSQVIIGEYLYAAGGNILHKINIANGKMEGSVNVPASAKLNETQYLCYGNGMLYFAIRESITAFSISNLSQKWQVKGEFGQYHPLQYLEHNDEGFIWCNGNVFKASTGEKITIKQKDFDEALLISDFAWSAGAQNGGYFYVTDKNYVYSIDMNTWKVKDQVNYFTDKTSSYNTSGQVAFDGASNRLFWGCKNYYSKNLYSVKLDENGSFATDSLIVTEAGFNSVNAPIIYNNRVYLIGQGKPFAAVFDINGDEISLKYTVGDSSVTVQSNAVLSTAYEVPRVYFIGFDGKVYMLEDNGGMGSVTALAQTPNPSNVLYPNSYEPLAIDNNGNIYCYNESGYLFCYGKSACEIPTITKDLNTDRVKYAVGVENVAPLTVEATISEGAGELSYQWQSSVDKKNWTDIKNEITASFTPSAAEANETYYRCVITNTQDGKTAKATSSVAHILVKVLSNNASLNILANTANKLDGGTAGKKIDGTNIVAVENFNGTMKYLALGAVDEGTFEPIKENITLYQGLPAGTKLPSVSTVSNSELYTRRYWRSAGFTLPFVASVEVTAEDGTTGTAYIVVDNDTLGSYAIAVSDITSEDAKYNKDTNTINFKTADETVALAPVTTTIGKGAEDKTAYTWTSSDTTVAVVNSDGVVKCIGGGDAVITFTCGQLTKTCTVTSSAAEHNIHTYGEDDKCTACGTAAPTPVTAYFSLVGADGSFVTSKDGVTEIYKADLTVEDKDFDGKLTLNDAFIDLHETHSANGTADFVTEERSFGPYITKLWGKNATVGVGYYHNNASAMGITEELKKNDVVTAYFYRDLTGWSDVYTYIEGQKTVGAKFENEYTVKGVAGGNAVIPEGATVKVFDSEGSEVTDMQTTVGADGTFTLVFKNAGNYVIEVSGEAAYNGTAWDSVTSSYDEKKFENAPVIPSRLAVEVKPYAEKTAYISISMKNGKFAVNKNGNEMYYFPVIVTDDPEKPDGNVTLAELLEAAHVQYHEEGESAVAGHTDNFITKLWGESNSGNASYYFNDVYMSGSGTKTGSNGREFTDKLLNTTVENGDHLYVYSFQTNDWSKGDLYTYFYPINETATAGTAKTFTVKSTTGYGTNANKLETSLVTVKGEDGNAIEELAATVGADGTFTITFPQAGTYTVDVRTNGTNYVTPARLTVKVEKASSNPGLTEKVSVSVIDPQGKTYKAKTEYPFEEGMTAYSLLMKTGLNVETSNHTEYGVYIEAIEGLGEFDEGATSGWMYKVNGEFPDYSSDLYVLSAGDYVEWVYTRDLGEDVGDDYVGGTTVKNAIDIVEEIIADIGDVTLESKTAIEEARAAYDALTDAQKKLVENYDELLDAESRYEALVKAEKLPFTDITNHWAIDAINYVYDKNIMTGTSGTAFEPDTALSRGMLTAVLYRLEGSPEITAENPFSDVKADEWYTDAVIWAYENGIVQGFDGNFEPNGGITREQFALMLMNYAKYKRIETSAKNGLSQFADADDVSLWAVDAMKWAVEKGYITGRDTGLAAKSSASRAETAVILMRFIENK